MAKRAQDRPLEFLYKWATQRVPMDHSKKMLEEIFLWGCQTALSLNGVRHTSPQFIVDASLLLGRRGRKVEGWYIRMNDGTSFNLIKPKAVIRKGIQRQSGSKAKPAKVPAASSPVDAGMSPDIAGSDDSQVAPTDVPVNGEQLVAFMSRAAIIVREVLPKAGIREVQSGPLVRDWLLKQSGKPKINKISAAKFEELVSKLEAVSNTPAEVVKILNS